MTLRSGTLSVPAGAGQLSLTQEQADPIGRQQPRTSGTPLGYFAASLISVSVAIAASIAAVKAF
jgi:hypothetical protein